MPYTDMPLEEVRNYKPALKAPADLGEFWADTLADTRSHAIDVAFEVVDTSLRLVDVYDVTFAGFGGDPVRAWLRLPSGRRGPFPAVVQFQGYGGGRGLPHQDLMWATAGYAHLMMDTRGQGAMGSRGDTSDPRSSGQSHVDGFMTDGILSPESYYYRRVMADAVRAVEAVRSHPAVDAAHVAVRGGSQGGGLSLATAGLVPDLAAVMADVAFLSDFPRAIRIADRLPYTQIARYLRTHRDRVGQVERTLSYFDAAILGRSATAPALFSVALMDAICPPSTVYAAYNWYGGPKEMMEYEFNDHEGGSEMHDVAQMEWLSRVLSDHR